MHDGKAAFAEVALLRAKTKKGKAEHHNLHNRVTFVIKSSIWLTRNALFPGSAARG